MGRSAAEVEQAEAVYGLIDQMKRMSPPEAQGTLREIEAEVERMTTEIETLKLLASDPGVFTVWGPSFTGSEIKMLNALESAGERGVTYGGLLASLYVGQPECDVPDPAIFKVFKTRISEKFRRHGIPLRIDNRWGVGYVMRPSSAPLPERRSRA